MINPSSKIELHYYFNDNSHFMNAIIRNENEKEVLLIFKEFATSLNLDVTIESEAYSEGGLREFWKVLGKNSAQITLIIAAITIYLSRIPVENKELVKLQMENLKLDNELKQKELKEITEEIKEDSVITEELVEKVIQKLESDYKLIWHKSNFYKRISLYQKIESVSTQALDDKNNPTFPSKTILRNQFSSFIIHSNEFPAIIDEEAVIDIISPVLIKGNFYWRGIYLSKTISFEMRDREFQLAVLNKQIEFTNGSAIKCVFQQNRKIDELGVIQITHQQVNTVLEVIQGSDRQQTDQGKRFLRNKELNKNQMGIDFAKEGE